MARSEPLYITFHADGRAAGIGPAGDYPLAYKSRALFRYRLVDDEVVDLYAGLSDDQALARQEAEAAAQAERDREEAAAAAAAEPYTIFKTTIIGRMSDEELETFDEGYRAQPLRGRRMWDDCVSLVSIDPYFGMLRQLFTASYGEDRAKELLAPIV